MIDTILDRTVVLGYSRVGYAVRSRGWDEPGSLHGKVALVTGASSGLGRATVAGLARLGASVRMLVRNADRGEAARAAIAREVPGADLALELCDISRLEAVRTFAAGFRERVDVLVHNAGVMTHERTLTSEGNELTLATHVLGPHLLTALLAPAPKGRVLWVSSGGMYLQRLDVGDLQQERDHSGTRAYARTKRMQVVLAELWAERLAGDGIVVHSTHPGWADTPGLSEGLTRFHRLARPLLRTPEQGADTTVWLAAADEPGRCTGRFWHDRRPRPTHYLGYAAESDAERAALWEAVGRLTGA